MMARKSNRIAASALCGAMAFASAATPRRGSLLYCMKSIFVVVPMMAACVASAAITSRSYVQGGLVAQYDGIDNAGYGVHDASAKVWKDLTGNGNDGGCARLLSWSTDGWSVSADCKPVTIPAPGLAATMGKGTFTIQFACTPAIDNKRQAFFSQYNYTSAYGGFGLEHNNGSNKTGKIRYYKFTSCYPSGDGLDYLSGATISKDVFTSASFAMSPTEQKCWLNGTLADTRTDSLRGISSSCPSVIGGEVQVGGRTDSNYTAGYGITFQGEYNAFRLYNRTLTDDETKVNAAVDAIRFNGANPDDFTLGGGWSFVNGDLCVAVAATASGNGSVSGSATVAQYSTVTLVATPASGAVFKCWTGDIDAITSGNAYSPSVTVTAADPVTLTAVFMTPIQGLTAYSYIRRGLVANFDGIDNAGTGSHDSTATAWADLTGNGNNATKGSNASWNGTDGWTSSSDGKPMTIPAGNGSATTIAGTTAKQVFTAQFTVKPSRHDARQCFFGQYDKRGVSIEHNSGDSGKTGYMRAYYNYIPNTAATVADDKFKNSDVLVTTGEWAAMSLLSDTAQQTIWKNGEKSQTIAYSLTGKLTNICASVIGGDNVRNEMGFRGTYNAFRLYDRVLTEEEVRVNAAIDDKRFNNGAKGLQLPSGWSFANDDTLMVDVSATATAGGKISYRGGAAVASVSESINFDGSKAVAFSAIPDAGYVFDRWSGDVDLIEVGSALTPDITIDLLRPVALVANFRRNGDAADGKVFDVSFTGDAAADGLTFSATDAEETQGYETANVTLPVLPTVTNANVACLYLPQPTNAAGTGTYRQMAQSDKPAVTGLIATVFCRFRWDGPVLPAAVNYPAVILDGYTGWSTIGNGFIVRLRSAANETRGFFSIVVPGTAVDYNHPGITDIAGGGYVEPGEWVDCFVSVYPSPTNPTLSNADIWYCRRPKWNSGGYFTAPAIGHRHFGDGCNITLTDTKSSRLSFGTEPASNLQGADTGSEKAKCFRGAIAAAKGWNRLLSEGERYTVMAGFEGVQTFNNAETGTGRTVKTGTLSTMQGRNVTGIAFLGDTDTAHFQRAMATTHNTIKLVFDAPKGEKTCSYVYKTVIADAKTSNAQPVRLDFNGKTVWSSENVAVGTEIRVELSEADALPGINELTWHYDTPIVDNWLMFVYHQLRFGTSGLIISIW